MAMTPPRWNVSEESDYPWEREALQFLREHLPDVEPWRAWVNFEFIDDVGRVFPLPSKRRLLPNRKQRVGYE